MKFDVEELFTPSRWFVIFCGLLIVIWMALQWVANWRLEEEARIEAAQVFGWEWTNSGWNSTARITRVAVVSRSDTDAVVEVDGQQTVNCLGAEPPVQTLNCRCRLSFYRDNKRWRLASVDL